VQLRVRSLHHWPVSTPIGWLVVQRDLTGSVQVRDATEIWFTAVFSTPSRKIAGGDAASSAHDSLVGAVRQAIRAPAGGAPSGHPAVVVAASGLVDEVRDVLREEGVRAAVDEVAPPDWAEDVSTELTGHLAGRVQVADPPDPADWALPTSRLRPTRSRGPGNALPMTYTCRSNSGLVPADPTRSPSSSATRA
jgi:hypothetical protein